MLEGMADPRAEEVVKWINELVENAGHYRTTVTTAEDVKKSIEIVKKYLESLPVGKSATAREIVKATGLAGQSNAKSLMQVGGRAVPS